MKAKIKVGAFEVELDGTPSELAAVLTALQTAPLAQPPVFVPQFSILDCCPMGGSHEYEPVWIGMSPPPCKKCGQVQFVLPVLDVQYTPDMVTNPMPPCRTTIVPMTQTGVPVSRLEDLLVRQGCTD